MAKFRQYRQGLILVLLFVSILGAVNLLPADSSLKLVRQSGLLRVCVPTRYPPLVSDNAQQPGIDVEILQLVAENMELRLLPVHNQNMGRDFNPRNWRVTRAQCAVLAGGVVSSDLTRSLLDTSDAYLHSTWALISPTEIGKIEGLRIGFHAGISGLDRIAVGRFLRAAGAEVTVYDSSQALAEGIATGQVDAGVSESVSGRFLAADRAWHARTLSDSLEEYELVFGLWKGDLTLKRAINAALRRIEANGQMAAILDRYGQGSFPNSEH